VLRNEVAPPNAPPKFPEFRKNIKDVKLFCSHDKARQHPGVVE